MSHPASSASRTSSLVGRWIAAALGCLVLTPAVDATRAVHRNADELARLADRIFVGTCISAEEKHDGSLRFTQYLFAVEEHLKDGGRPTRPLVTVRQLAAPPGGVVVGLPSYRPGARYLLMLHADSEIGLTSPVGFAQGAFLLYPSADGERAVNPLGNLGLFHRMSPDEPRYRGLSVAERALLGKSRGPVDAGRLIALTRRLVQGPGR